ncbi:MAG: SGNH/GDSL hydrolase family protein [Bacteroidetes bacterium]|nr:SGNH/GDSL hydrolase family protein [Bacteroidota bacterium]
MKKSTINFLVLITATVISFLAFEIIARNFLTVGEAYPPSSAWALERWLELEQKSKTKAEVTRHSIDRYDSLYGWTTKSNLREFGQHQGWIVNSNSKGVRGCIEHAYGKHSRLRIVTIGDSFTFGECVNDSQTSPAQLNKRLPDAEVINLGVHGYGHDQQLIKLIHEGLKYQPDIIVLGYQQDDVYRNMVSFRDYAKPYFVLKNNTLELKNVPVPFPEYFTNQFHLKSIGLLKAKWAEVTATYNGPENEILSKAILDSMVTLAQKQHALFITVYLPWDVQIMENGAKPLPTLFDSLCSRKGVLKVDPTQAFNQYLSGRTDTAGIFKCHYPPVFNCIIADLLAREIHNNNLLKEKMK